MADQILDVPVTSKDQDLFHRELARRSQDTIRVFNPESDDYVVDWDGYKHRIPSKGSADVPRYIAEKYCRDMTTLIINKMGDAQGAEMLKVRQDKGMPEFGDKYVENREIWDKVPKTNDDKLIKDLYPKLWIGLVNEFGVDYVDQKAETHVDDRNQEEKMLQELANKRVDEPISPPKAAEDSKEEKPPLYVSKKDQLAKEVTQDDVS